MNRSSPALAKLAKRLVLAPTLCPIGDWLRMAARPLWNEEDKPG